MILALASDGAHAGFAVHSKGIVYGLCNSERSIANWRTVEGLSHRPDVIIPHR